MRIVYASFDEVPAFKGSTTHILANCKALIKEHDVELFTLGETSLPKQRNFRHSPNAIYHPNYLQRALKFKAKFVSYLKKKKFDCIQFRTPWEGSVAIESGIPSIYELNGLPSIELPTYYPTIKNSTLEKLKSLESECIQQSQKIICHTPKTYRFIQQNWEVDVQKIHLIANGYHVPEKWTLPNRKFDNQQLKLVYLGTLSNWQGVHWSLACFRKLPEEITLDIYGPGRKQQVKDLQKQIRKLKLCESRIRFLGPLPIHQINHTLSHYDLGISPLLKDTRNAVQGCCPVKFCDYKLASLPILTSDIEVATKYVKDGYNGFLFHAGSRSNFVQTLTCILNNKHKLSDMAKNSFDSLNQHPSWEEAGYDLLSIYKTLGMNR